MEFTIWTCVNIRSVWYEDRPTDRSYPKRSDHRVTAFFFFKYLQHSPSVAMETDRPLSITEISPHKLFTFFPPKKAHLQMWWSSRIQFIVTSVQRDFAHLISSYNVCWSNRITLKFSLLRRPDLDLKLLQRIRGFLRFTVSTRVDPEDTSVFSFTVCKWLIITGTKVRGREICLHVFQLLILILLISTVYYSCCLVYLRVTLLVSPVYGASWTPWVSPVCFIPASAPYMMHWCFFFFPFNWAWLFEPSLWFWEFLIIVSLFVEYVLSPRVSQPETPPGCPARCDNYFFLN